MPCIDAATFDAKDLTPQSNADNTRVWKTAAGDMVTLYYFPKPRISRNGRRSPFHSRRIAPTGISVRRRNRGSRTLCDRRIGCGP